MNICIKITEFSYVYTDFVNSPVYTKQHILSLYFESNGCAECDDFYGLKLDLNTRMQKLQVQFLFGSTFII